MTTRTDILFDEAFLQRLQRLRLLAKHVAAGGGAGIQRSTRLGDGLEFADHRPYSSGDDVRFIDWPYYARMEKLLLRLFHLHREQDIAILLDTSASMAPGGQTRTLHHALRAAAALAYVAMVALDRVTVQPFGEDLAAPFQTGRNSEQILGLLDYLSALVPQGQTHLARCAESFSRAQTRPAGVFILSDLMGCSHELDPALAQLRRRPCDLAVLHTFGAEHACPALRGPVLLRDAETGQPMSLDVTDELTAAYRRRWEVFRAGCEHACITRGASYVSAPADAPFEKLILLTLRSSRILTGR